MPRPLRVFLCHASQDKPAVRELYNALKSEVWIDPWLDEEKLLGGQDFDLEIYKATRDADVIIVCLSKKSVVKEGYVNKEIRRALTIAQEKAEGAIYIIPLRLDDCNPSFEQLKKLHWVDYFFLGAHERLLKSLRVRAGELKIKIAEDKVDAVVKPKVKPKLKSRAKKEKPITRVAFPFLSDLKNDDFDLYRLIKIPSQKDSKISYPFAIGKYPVTNVQYERFLNSPDFADPVYWLEFPKFDKNCDQIGDFGGKGLNWMREEFKKTKSKVLMPDLWNHKIFGKRNPYHPVVGISWYEASAYCVWLDQNWDFLMENRVNSNLKRQMVRLPLETEWAIAAGGENPSGRFPWDENGKISLSLKEILQRTNVLESGIEHTTSVNNYPLGKSPFGVMDMAGNIWEWQANYYDDKQDSLSLRGGSWFYNEVYARVAFRFYSLPLNSSHLFGFRVMISLSDT